MLGERIGALRRSKGLSQAELAQKLGISASAMGMYEQGRREPAVQTLVALSRELGVTTDYLLTGKPEGVSDAAALTQTAEILADAAGKRLARRPDASFSREELTVLFTALLTDG
jgi:transcriptional regulator with XRE-family HTH domain